MGAVIQGAVVQAVVGDYRLRQNKYPVKNSTNAETPNAQRFTFLASAYMV